MNKTFKELLIFIIAILITLAIGFGILKLIDLGKTKIKKKENKEKELNLSWELKLKELIKKQIEIEEKIILDETINNAINVIIKKLEKYIKNNPYEIEIDIIDSPVINAVTFPGGYIIIYSGLIKITDNPEELASIISHEIAHVIYKDSLNSLKRNFGIAILFTVVTGGDPNFTDQIIRNILNNQFSQNMERKADEFAAELMIKSGINPKIYSNILKKLKEKENNLLNKKIMKYIGTHPDIDSRIEKTNKMAELFRGNEYKFDIDWAKVKKSLPTVFDQ